MATRRQSNYSNNNNRNSGNSNNGQNRKKHSGAKYRASDKNGNPCTTGWNYSKRHGLVKFLCVFTSATKVVDSNSGRQWANVMVKVTKPMAAPVTVSGMMDVVS